ncbi:hypothetical protein BKA81DRAFT_5936 [Phyllosticta paracitricarpa]
MVLYRNPTQGSFFGSEQSHGSLGVGQATLGARHPGPQHATRNVRFEHRLQHGDGARRNQKLQVSQLQPFKVPFPSTQPPHILIHQVRFPSHEPFYCANRERSRKTSMAKFDARLPVYTEVAHLERTILSLHLQQLVDVQLVSHSHQMTCHNTHS